MNKLINPLHRFGLNNFFIEFEFFVRHAFYSKLGGVGPPPTFVLVIFYRVALTLSCSMEVFTFFSELEPPDI